MKRIPTRTLGPGPICSDIAGRVRYIGITSEQDGVTELGAIRNARQVAALVAMILQAPVNQ
jgi:hypothetical protein